MQARRAELVQAVGRLLAVDGFEGLGVNAVAREAGVDKVLIYRYFGGLSGLLREYGEVGDFWPSVEEIVGDDFSDLNDMSLGERWATILIRYARNLRAREVTLEILAWQGIEKNELIEVLQGVQQRWFDALLETFPEDTATEGLPETVLLLAAGATYLMIRSRTGAEINAMTITSETEWANYEERIQAICTNTLIKSQGALS